MALPTSTDNVTVRKLASTLDAYNTKLNTKFGGKADKVANATNGHLASLDGNGNLADSGKSASDFVEKSAGVTNVAYDTTKKKITKTVNGSTTDVVSASTLKTDMNLGNVTNDAQVKRTEMGTANGVATLDANGKIPSSQIPGSYDDVKEGYLYNGKFYYDAEHTQEITAAADMVYVDKSTNKTYRWSGTQYVVIGSDLALGETSSTAYRGDRGKAAYDFSQAPYTSAPAMDGTASAGSSTKWAKGDHVHPSDTSREAVANKKTSWSSTPSDTNYPSEKLVKDSLDNKVDKVSGKGLSTNDFTDTLKTKLDGISTGANKVQSSSTNGNIKIDGTETTVYTHPTTTAVAAAAKKVGNDANGHVVLGDALAKGDVGLGNVDNTSDATKKTNFTGAVASGNTGFPTGGDVYDAIAANGKGFKQVTYGVTTFAEITAILESGRIPYLYDSENKLVSIFSGKTLSQNYYVYCFTDIIRYGANLDPLLITYQEVRETDSNWSSGTDSIAYADHDHELKTLGFAYCASTSNSGANFSVDVSDLLIHAGGILVVKFSSSAVPAGATLKAGNYSAKSIYYQGSAITDGVIQQNDVATLMFDGNRYQLIAVNRSIKEMTDSEVNDLIGALS